MGLPLPLILVFGLYHLMTWFNILNINSRVYWKRVALVSAIAHVLLSTGFFVFRSKRKAGIKSPELY